MVSAMLRARAVALVVVGLVLGSVGCEEDELLDDPSPGDGAPIEGDGDELGDGEDPFDGTPGQDTDASVGLDAGTRDAATGPEPDAGEGPDVVLGSDCVEEFVWDPAGRTDVTGVVVASGELSGWIPEGSPQMRLEADGKYHLTVGMFMSAMAYKFVVNGAEWLPDPNECHTESDGNGGVNSIRYACQTPPSCPVIGECPAPAPTDLGDGCPTTFTFDPGEREDVERVVLVGSAPLTWDFASCDAIPLVREEDGVFRVTVDLPLTSTPIEYKFVINDNRDGAGWTEDPTNCHTTGDNSLLYCDEAPECPSEPDGGVPDGGTVDAGAEDAGAADAGAEDAGAADGGTGLDAGSDAATDFDAGSSDGGGLDAALSDAGASGADCSCFRTVWVDLDDDARVVQDDIEGVYLFGDHPDFGDWTMAGGHGELSAVLLQNAGEGVWFSRVAPPADGIQYKVYVRHLDEVLHPPVYLDDRGNCFPRVSDNSVMYTCGAEPEACSAAEAPVSLPGRDVDLCTLCNVEVTIPETASAAIGAASSVALRGERSPLSWNADLELTYADGVYTTTLSLPRGRWEYLLRLDDDDGMWMRDPSHACRATNNSVLYACSARPACP